ncbi:MAG: addiction module protein [Bacteroidia bacterium]
MNSLNLKINLSFQQLLEVVKQLSIPEKIKLNEFIWDESMQIPETHQNIVLERKQKSKSNPGRMKDWDKASKTLKP